MKKYSKRLMILLLMVADLQITALAGSISDMRTSLECGWLVQMVSVPGASVATGAQEHIVAGARIAADHQLGREALEKEVREASERVEVGIEDLEYLERMYGVCGL
jgi:hypothetical protein